MIIDATSSTASEVSDAFRNAAIVVGVGGQDLVRVWKSRQLKIQRDLLDSTVARTKSAYHVDDVRLELLARLDAASMAAVFLESVSVDDLTVARNAAKSIVNAQVFSDTHFPEITIDPYGEVSFTMRRPRGYVDIGVDTSNQLSYHIRNDQDGSSTFDDVDFASREVPSRLVEALRSV